ncbi:MAG: HAMP domain-containing histidine kinase [Bacteroidales bacterium]|nr:HAMP domain-containing histidine kinase [Lachnoclostridium sp.]MCM1384319.1 HAMP domain-containing histidine kinase [Lachnoclostridium sp.]MCM1464900.1 HAMP domain-containing histidine kinase [Bacteroidales bacterium]
MKDKITDKMNKIKDKLQNKARDKREDIHDARYSRLKQKLFLRILGLPLIAILIIFILYRLYRSHKVVDFIVSLYQRLFDLNYYAAVDLYHITFRENEFIILLIAATSIFGLLLLWVIRWFVKYFTIVNQGIDDLLNDEEEIFLPTELLATESRLNAVKKALKQSSLDAKLAEQRKNDLVMYLAHDIRTPLTSVIGYLNLLEEVPDMPEKQRINYIHITLDKAYRLEKMINEFFEITRYNLQQIVLNKETIDLYYMMLQLTDELSPILAANANTAVLNVPENLTVYGDPDKLARVFNNVLKNAAAYSYRGTEIIIRAEEKESFVEISFQNKGKTIPKEKLATIFEKFYRLDESRSSHTGGTGLGLAIAKEIVTVHGGNITADSENDTVSFVITLPMP